MDRAQVADRLRKFFELEDRGIVAAYLFGSVARERGRADSDIDVAVIRRRPQSGTLDALPLRLEGELEETFGHEVQVVALDLASPDLIRRVLRDGLIVFESNRSERIAFEVRARNQYWDVKPLLDEYRKLR